MSLLRSFDSTGPKRSRGEENTNQASVGETKKRTSGSKSRALKPKSKKIEQLLSNNSNWLDGNKLLQSINTRKNVDQDPNITAFFTEGSIFFTSDNEFIFVKADYVYKVSGIPTDMPLQTFNNTQNSIKTFVENKLSEENEFRILYSGKFTLAGSNGAEVNGIYVFNYQSNTVLGICTTVQIKNPGGIYIYTFRDFLTDEQIVVTRQPSLVTTTTFRAYDGGIDLGKFDYRTYIPPSESDKQCYQNACGLLAHNKNVLRIDKAVLYPYAASISSMDDNNIMHMLKQNVTEIMERETQSEGTNVTEIIKSQKTGTMLFTNRGGLQIHQYFNKVTNQKDVFTAMNSAYLVIYYSYGQEVQEPLFFKGNQQIIIRSKTTYRAWEDPHDFNYRFHFWEEDSSGETKSNTDSLPGAEHENVNENIQWLRANHEKLVCIMTVALVDCNTNTPEENKLDRHRILMHTINTWVKHGWSILLFYPSKNAQQYEICSNIKKKEKYKPVFKTVPYELIDGTCNNTMNVGQSRNAILKFAEKFGDLGQAWDSDHKNTTRYNIMKSLLVIDERVHDIQRVRFPVTQKVSEPSDVQALRRLEGFNMLHLVKKTMDMGYQENVKSDWIDEQKKSDKRWSELNHYGNINLFKSPTSFYVNGDHLSRFSLYDQIVGMQPGMLGVIADHNFRQFQNFTPPQGDQGLPGYDYDPFVKQRGGKKVIFGVHGAFKRDDLTAVQNLILIKLNSWKGKLYYPHTAFAEDLYFGAQWCEKVKHLQVSGVSRQLGCIYLNRNMDGKTLTRNVKDMITLTECGLHEYANLVQSSTYAQINPSVNELRYLKTLGTAPKCTWHYTQTALDTHPRKPVNWQSLMSKDFHFAAENLCQLDLALQRRGKNSPDAIKFFCTRLIMFLYGMNPLFDASTSFKNNASNYEDEISQLNNLGMLEEAKKIWSHLIIEILIKIEYFAPNQAIPPGRPLNLYKNYLATREGGIKQKLPNNKRGVFYSRLLFEWPDYINGM